MLRLATGGLGLISTITGSIVLDEKTGVNIGTIVILFGAIWWLGRKLQSLEDGQKALSEKVSELPCQNCPSPKRNL